MSQPHSQAARTIGERIRERRLELALSQEDLAELAEMHVTNIGKIERGQANPSLHTLVIIAGALNLNPAIMVDGITPDMVPGRTHKFTAADLIREKNRRDGTRGH